MHGEQRGEVRGGVLSVVVPTYNEQEVVAEFHSRTSAVLERLDMAAEILYVNDGSTDDTLEELQRLAAADDRVSVVDLSRNFGKEIAITAGLDHAVGDAVVVIDADLQDPPELIPELVAEWRNGFEVVYARRMCRDGESWMKKATAFLFYRLIQRMSRRVQIPADTGDFRLLSRRAVDALGQFKERNRFMKGLFAWIGFAQTAVPYRREPRKAGTTKWNYVKLWNFALEGITSFSSMPLKAATYVGTLAALGAFAFGGYVVVKTLIFGEPVAGYPSLIAVITFIGGVQLVAIGIMGEYVARMFEETKGRPIYLVNEYMQARAVAPFGAPEARRARDLG
jgi:glycosyltransferase involved in cell wall biosynthesis